MLFCIERDPAADQSTTVLWVTCFRFNVGFNHASQNTHQKLVRFQYKRREIQCWYSFPELVESDISNLGGEGPVEKFSSKPSRVVEVVGVPTQVYPVDNLKTRMCTIADLVFDSTAPRDQQRPKIMICVNT